jgi:DNA-binding LytR/AlgR family response regulator
MNTYNCIIVDDMESAVEVLENHVRKLPQLILVKTFTNSLEALKFLENNPIEIVFLDIEMPHLGGLDLIERLRLKLCDALPSFVLTTGHEEYALSAYEKGAIGYLVKPIIFKQFKITIDSIIRNWKNDSLNYIPSQNNEYFFIECEGARVKMNYKDISYLECDGNYIKLVEGKRERMIYRSMRDMEILLFNHGFLRVHKSYIISLHHFHALRGNEITMNVPGEEPKIIPVGATYKDEIQKRMKTL